MTTALIFAGGTGQRMNTRSKPKQFLELHGKPIIIYTLEHFENHPEIDNIVVVCLESWLKELKRFISLYGFEKVSQIIPGGEGGDISIFNGLQALNVVCKDDDIVLIHDGVRPLINAELISQNIKTAKEKGTSITVEAARESVVKLNGNSCIESVPPRDKMYSAKAPQSFKYGLIWSLYKKARQENIRTIDSAHLCSIYNVEMHTVKSTPNNIKITAPQDYYIFRSLYKVMEYEQLIGVCME
jgi:2-C-methyl-D-erythritol 4-phosphate cytidylyltransferase